MAFPVRILESVSFSTPLIVSTMCDMGQLVEDCGLVIDPAVPEDLARAIVKLAEDPVLYEKLSRGCTTALERYDPAVSLATIESVLMER
jgi:glycosyltransferase involved in cell wall biosynthesis